VVSADAVNGRKETPRYRPPSKPRTAGFAANDIGASPIDIFYDGPPEIDSPDTDYTNKTDPGQIYDIMAIIMDFAK
jgi:hypothetical protein